MNLEGIICIASSGYVMWHDEPLYDRYRYGCDRIENISHFAGAHGEPVIVVGCHELDYPYFILNREIANNNEVSK